MKKPHRLLGLQHIGTALLISEFWLRLSYVKCPLNIRYDQSTLGWVFVYPVKACLSFSKYTHIVPFLGRNVKKNISQAP